MRAISGAAMEAEAQRLQNALPDIAVYLGSEWLVKQPAVPHVVVMPGNADYSPPAVPGSLAAVRLQETYLCRAMTFEEAVQLAEFAYAALAPGQSASVRLGTEVWGDYFVRTAALTITYPATLTREDVTRVRVKDFTQHAQFTNPNKEVPDGTNQDHRPTGRTYFDDSPGPG
ncbi:hypothetical protein ACFP81_10660 [Deinococcus lacus]|uniref:Tail terminator n=1 Tax=Deinococcus lacus TaxID=392561 RepID=A0ABW1YDS3_9DEIO